MKRGVVFAAVVVAFAVTVPAGAGVTTTTDRYQFVNLNWNTCNQTQCENGVVTFLNRAGLQTVDAAATPMVQSQAEGWIDVFTYDPCCSSSFNYFPLQTVAPTALTMDQVGNSATLNATLNGNNGPGVVALTMTRPTSMTYGPACTLPCVNAWTDGATVGASNYSAFGVSRYGYTLSGSIFGSAPSSGIWTYSFNGIGSTVGAVAP